MAHVLKLDFVFPWNGRVHLSRWGCKFSRLLAAEVCASAWVMLDISRSEVAWEYWLPTPFASFPFTSPPVRHRVPPGSERALTKYYSLACIVYEWLTWCLTLREELRLTVFREGLLSRIFGFKTEEETGGWTKLHNEKLHELRPPITIRKVRSSGMIWAGRVTHTRKKRSIKSMIGK